MSLVKCSTPENEQADDCITLNKNEHNKTGYISDRNAEVLGGRYEEAWKRRAVPAAADRCQKVI